LFVTNTKLRCVRELQCAGNLLCHDSILQRLRNRFFDVSLLTV
jgi:hypothetical protein